LTFDELRQLVAVQQCILSRQQSQLTATLARVAELENQLALTKERQAVSEKRQEVFQKGQDMLQKGHDSLQERQKTLQHDQNKMAEIVDQLAIMSVSVAQSVGEEEVLYHTTKCPCLGLSTRLTSQADRRRV
jgi:hypothetical protein